MLSVLKTNICIRCAHKLLCNRPQTILSRCLVSSKKAAVDDDLFDVAEEDIPEIDEEYTYQRSRTSLPLMTSRELEFPNRYRGPRQAWIETLDTMENEKLGIIDLHPDVFAAYPRVDILHKNIVWQRKYKYIDYRFTMTRAEVPGSNRKLWPQKGTGRRRVSTKKGPNWHKGGVAFGPRGPKSHFYMLPRTMRAMGLRVALSVKYAQNDLHIVDSLEIPNEDPQYIEDLFDTRYWGFTALFVDDTDLMPRNISLALDKIPHFNMMPVYGLNVYSMLRYETLVLTVAAVEKLEQKLLAEMHSPEREQKFKLTK